MSEETTMSDITLTAVSVSTSSRKKSLAETKDSIKWYSWLGGELCWRLGDEVDQAAW